MHQIPIQKYEMKGCMTDDWCRMLKKVRSTIYEVRFRYVID